MNTELTDIARRVVWYQDPQMTIQSPTVFLSHAFRYGSLTDWVEIEKYFSLSVILDVLNDPQVGIIDPVSWHFWHVYYGILPVPPLPTRAVPH